MRAMARSRQSRQERQAVAREVKDILLKRLAAAVPDSFLAALGLDLPPVTGVLPAELPVLTVRATTPDLVLRLADGSLAHLEFQTTSAATDLRRFYRYHVALSEHYDCPVHTIVLYGPGIRQVPTTLDRGSMHYQIRPLYLGQRDGEQVVARLRARSERGERWTAAEHVEAMLLPLMGRQRPLPLLVTEVAAASAVLPHAERLDLLGSLLGLAYNYLETGTAEQLLEALHTMNVFEELIAESVLRGRVEGRVEGRQEGMVAGRQQAVLHALRKRFGALSPILDQQIEALRDEQRLILLFDAALDTESLEAFDRLLGERLPHA
jgi:predicted transposase YdaD